MDTELQRLAADRDAAVTQANRLPTHLDAAQTETERLHARITRIAASPDTIEGIIERLQWMLEVYRDEASEMRAPLTRGTRTVSWLLSCPTSRRASGPAHSPYSTPRDYYIRFQRPQLRGGDMLEALRILKRRLSDVVYQALRADTAEASNDVAA